MVTTLGALPVKWLEFTGKLQEDAIKLKWATAFEQNNNYFKIERSLNGTDFFSIGQIKSQGNSSTRQSYSFTDPETKNLIKNITRIFYRIRQVDLDEQHTFSPVIQVNLPGKKAPIVFPNPIKEGSLAGIFIGEEQEVKAGIYNVAGKLIFEQLLMPGYNVLKIKKEMSGLYFINLIYSDGNKKTVEILIE